MFKKGIDQFQKLAKRCLLPEFHSVSVLGNKMFVYSGETSQDIPVITPVPGQSNESVELFSTDGFKKMKGIVEYIKSHGE